MGLIAEGTLTRHFLMAQQTGAYIVSNSFVHGDVYTPRFGEVIARREGRLAQWQRVKLAKANGRLCHVFRVKRDYRRWVDAILSH